MVNFLLILVEIIIVKRVVIWINGVPEGNTFIICHKNPQTAKKSTPKGDKLHTVFAILYMLTQ